MKFTLRVIVTTVLAVAALAFATVPAQAQTIERIEGSLEPCVWTFFNTVRTQARFEAIYFDPSIKDTNQGYYMALINHRTGDVFTSTTYWGPHDYSLKLITSAVLADTKFRIAMDKDRCGESGRHIAGYLHYNK